jgi:hypothetical protein
MRFASRWSTTHHPGRSVRASSRRATVRRWW